MPIIIPQRFSQRYDTVTNWTAKNPVLWSGEIAYGTDGTGKVVSTKVGDGTTSWTGLPEAGGGGVPSGGTTGQVLTKLSATDGDADWRTPSGGGGSASTFCAIDSKTSGTSGGNSVVGSQRRDLNSVLLNTISGASLSANKITLPAGTYLVDASASMYRGSRHKLYLYDETHSAALLIGSSEFNEPNYTQQTRSFVRGAITLSSTTVVSLMHYAQTAQTGGLGVASSISGMDEIYAQICITVA